MSTALHGLLGLVLWYGASRPECPPELVKVYDTRLPETEIDVVFFDPPRAKSRVPAQQPESIVALPPVVLEPKKQHDDYRSAPLVPRFSQTSDNGSTTALEETGRSGSGQRAEFFQIAGRGQSFVFVIDRSASMGPSGGLSTAKRQLAETLRRLPASARFQIIVYNRSAEPLDVNGCLGLMPATPANVQRALDLLQRVDAEGSTDHFLAMRRALALEADVVWFLTDADDLRAQDVRALTALNRGRSIVHTVELRSNNGSGGSLQSLAAANGGNYRGEILKNR
jgi:hypothetical protein